MAALRDRGSRGVHLLVGYSNQRATGFCRHIGLTELPSTGFHIFGIKLAEEDAFWAEA